MVLCLHAVIFVRCDNATNGWQYGKIDRIAMRTSQCLYLTVWQCQDVDQCGGVFPSLILDAEWGRGRGVWLWTALTLSITVRHTMRDLTAHVRRIREIQYSR